MKKIVLIISILTIFLFACGREQETVDYEEYFANIVEKQSTSVDSPWWEESIAPSGQYEDKVFTCYIDGEYIPFDLSGELTAAEEWNWSAAGVFRREGEDKTYVCLGDRNLLYEEGTVQAPQLLLLEFDTDNPENYELYPFEVEPADTFGWEVDACYRLGNEIFISFRNELAAIHLDTKQMRYCREEYNYLKEYADSRLEEKESLHNFRAVYTQDDVTVYGAQISEIFTDPAAQKVFVAMKDGKPAAYMYMELTEDGQVKEYDILNNM